IYTDFVDGEFTFLTTSPEPLAAITAGDVAEAGAGTTTIVE
ncbi:MAG: hypothetical protein JWQ19_3739, partial [Subtercola sp.]|nr:hypothetical protein [Subtercola sp.]